MDKYLCKYCKISFKSKEIRNRHIQYIHNINKKQLSCSESGCLRRPFYHNNTRCTLHREITKIRKMSLSDCIKYDDKLKIQEKKKNKKRVKQEPIENDEEIVRISKDRVDEFKTDISEMFPDMSDEFMNALNDLSI